nr:immunoglobulin heavy chain junction region [Macaca mulatta]MOY18343.1 immunoglobulin heavy chain junction region [Macaca mulatta]MOY19100.1 immunoglobulin heavy chain junction region [Macaca mulatta]MOY20511.1 immunoglobulin heavy chain junction region [Macaca mulatta]
CTTFTMPVVINRVPRLSDSW